MNQLQKVEFSIALSPGGQLLRTLQFLRFQSTVILLRLLRAHLHGLSPRQLENQFHRFGFILSRGIRLLLLFDELEGNLQSRTNRKGFTAENAQLIDQATRLVDEVYRTAANNLGRDNRGYRRRLGDELSWRWSVLCRFASNQAGFSDYMSIACQLQATFGCKAICNLDDWRERACAVSDQQGLNSLFARLRISLLDASPLVRSVNNASLVALKKLLLASNTLMQGAAKVPYKQRRGKALAAVRELLEAARGLSGLVQTTQFRIPDNPENIDWDDLGLRLTAMKGGLSAIRVYRFFTPDSLHQPAFEAQLARAQELIDAVLSAASRLKEGDALRLEDALTIVVD